MNFSTAGDKLGERVAHYFPKDILGRWCEPFLEDCELFLLSGVKHGVFYSNKRFLVDVYNILKTAPIKLYVELHKLWSGELANSSRSVRACYKNGEKDPVKRAAGIIFSAAQGCHIRISMSGSSYKTRSLVKNICDLTDKTVMDFSSRIQGCVFSVGTYKDIPYIKDDFVYFKPPFVLSAAAFETELITKREFLEIMDFCLTLKEMGIHFVVRNSRYVACYLRQSKYPVTYHTHRYCTPDNVRRSALETIIVG